MANKWNEWYKDINKDDIGSFRYGDTLTYTMGYEYLKNLDTIEDWGCGVGGFKRFFVNEDANKYKGIDGSKTPFSDVQADLREYVSSVDGIFMRHVLEHNYDWKMILENACQSFNKKMCLILFTPFSDTTKEIAHNLKHGVDVPDLSFKKDDLTQVFEKHGITYEFVTIQSRTGYNVEYVVYLTKKKD